MKFNKIQRTAHIRLQVVEINFTVIKKFPQNQRSPCYLQVACHCSISATVLCINVYYNGP
jgi:hypothetical protein